MDKIFDKIVLAFAQKENLLLSDDEFTEYDQLVDDEITRGGLTQYDRCGFIGTILAEKINERLPADYKIIALYPTDARIDVRTKGQAAYFLVNDKIAILAFSLNAITFFPSIKETILTH